MCGHDVGTVFTAEGRGGGFRRGFGRCMGGMRVIGVLSLRDHILTLEFQSLFNCPRKSVKNLRERERYCYIKSRHEHQSGHIFCPLLNIQVKSMKRIAIQTHRFTLSPYLSTCPLKDQSDESGDGEGGGESIHLS